ncbi:MAG: T9SS type A sorting domain-containing protein [Bacteroidia bacterium]
MKKSTLFIILILSCKNLLSQTPVAWSAPVVISSANGYAWPRVCLVNDKPLITWGDNNNFLLMMSRNVTGSFTSPLQLSPAGVAVTCSALTGPDVDAKGDTIYVTYTDDNLSHAYLQRSFDGGNTFSDTIKVDNIGTDLAHYPTVAIQDDGNPVIAFAKLDVNFANPQYAVTKSYNAGTSFLPDVSATATLGADPCDCCPGNITIDGNKIVVIYRNAIADVRDFRCAISTDTANNFLSVGLIDTNNWIMPNCPSSGGTGLLNGDTLTSIFMNGITGALVYVSTYNIITHQLGFEKKIFDVTGGSQNFPRIAGRGDTLATVWTQFVNGERHIMFSYSTAGAAGLGNYIDTLSLPAGAGFYNSPDVTYANGKFHIVFTDDVSQVYYVQGSINTASAIALHDDDQQLNIFFSSDNTTLNITSNKEWNEKTDVKIFTADGKLIDGFKIDRLNNSQLMKLHHRLTTGIYYVNVYSKNVNVSKQVSVFGR